MNWKHGYVHGPYEILKQWEIDTFPPDKETGKPQKPGLIVFRSSCVYPMYSIGMIETDKGSVERFKRDPDNPNILALISLRPAAQDYVNQLEALDGVSVHMVGRNEIAELYPEFACGQAIPYTT